MKEDKTSSKFKPDTRLSLQKALFYSSPRASFQISTKLDLFS